MSSVGLRSASILTSETNQEMNTLDLLRWSSALHYVLNDYTKKDSRMHGNDRIDEYFQRMDKV